MCQGIKMKRIYHFTVFSIKFRKLFFFPSSQLFQYVSPPLRFCPLPDQFRLKNENRTFSTDSNIDYENLLTRADVQEYLQLLNNECDKFRNGQTCTCEILAYINEVKDCENHLKNLETLANNNKELDELVKAEEEQFKNKIKHNYMKILSLANARDKNKDDKGAIIEVSPGVGGIEAKLFAEEVFEMYLKYVDFKGWNIDYLDKVCSVNGLMTRGVINISSKSVYNFLKHEAGIHRVQRIPTTEKAGKVQTSTCKVHVLPSIEENEIELKDSDLKIETKLSSGPGGQNVQKTETAVRIIHLPTGISVESQRERSQKVNIKVALHKLKILLYQREQTKQQLDETELRQKQAGTVLRSDKIRTYNFSQNRVTDHRINHTVHNVKMLMEGSDLLNELICLLVTTCEKESLLRNIARMLKEKNVDEMFNR